MKRFFTLLFTLFMACSAYAGQTYNPFTNKFDKCVTVEETDGTPSNKTCKKILIDNNSFTDNGDGTFSFSPSGAAGQAVTLDIGDDSGNDSVDLGEIATTGDTNSVITEPSADKMLINFSNNWPTADAADALSANPTDCGANEFADAIAANGNLTCNAIVDADVPDTITVSNYLPLAGGTMTGEMTSDDLGIEFTPGDALTDCTTFAATGGGIFYDDSEGKFKKCQDNTLTDLDTGSAETNSLESTITGVLDTEIFIGNGADSGTFASVSGDATLANTGALTIADNSVDGTDIAIGGDAQGDVLYYDGTDWVVLTAGNDGQQLETNGAAADPTWEWSSRKQLACSSNASTILAGTPVYATAWNASGILEVNIADADNGSALPAIGLAGTDIDTTCNGGDTDIVFFSGILAGLDTSTPGWSVGDDLYVSTNGACTTNFYDCLTSTAPTGEANSIQKIGEVTRSNAGNGSILIFGAGRANATPNLDSAAIFVGNSSNQAAAVDMSGDVTISNTGVTTVADDSHAHVIANIDSMTSSALAGQISDETGTGVAVFGTAPTFTTSITSTLVITDLIDGSGAVDLDYGSVDITDHTFVTDGTGTAEIVLPAGSIDSTEILDSTIATGDIAADTITHANIADADQTDTKCFKFQESDGVDADDDLTSIWANKTANDFLITEIWCETDTGTVTAMFQVDDGTPADVDSVDIACDSDEQEDTSLDGDTTVAAGEELDWAITSTATTPTDYTACFTGNWVD